MNIIHLRSFYNTVKYKSISKAAKELHLSQPGLSMQIQNLENTLGVSLLNRSRRGVDLTDEGKIVYDYADSILSLEDNMLISLQNLSKRNNNIKIGSCKSMGEYALPCTLYTFKQIYSDINISMHIDSTFSIIKKIQDMTLNLGIIQESSVPNDLECKVILSDELVLVANKDYPHSKIYISDLYDLPIVMRDYDSATRVNLENILKKNGIDINRLNVIFEFNSLEAIKQSVSSGKCFSFIPKITIRQELRDQSLKSVIVENLDTKFNYYISYRKNHTFSKSEKCFMKFILSKSRCFCY